MYWEKRIHIHNLYDLAVFLYECFMLYSNFVRFHT